MHKAPLGVLCAWSVAMLGARMWYSGRGTFSFLAWNLLLAAVPVVMAVALQALALRRAPGALQFLVFGAWLAFLPNAPYLITDFVHLASRPPVPLWYDIAMLGSFAATGALLGYGSVADVEAVIADRFGTVAGALVAFGSLGLCGFGIYLGRFGRWNSWDLLTAPSALAREAAAVFADPFAHPRALVVSTIYGLALMLGYAALHGFARSLPRNRPG
ncbi:MAG: DUF1361 domain-containing protein [Coriobacteriia bacterium]